MDPKDSVTRRLTFNLYLWLLASDLQVSDYMFTLSYNTAVSFDPLFSAVTPTKEQKQVRVYQWHSLVPYFNSSEPKPVPDQPKSMSPMVATKAAKKLVVFPHKLAIHESISENSKLHVCVPVCVCVSVFSSKSGCMPSINKF